MQTRLLWAVLLVLNWTELLRAQCGFVTGVGTQYVCVVSDYPYKVNTFFTFCVWNHDINPAGQSDRVGKVTVSRHVSVNGLHAIELEHLCQLVAVYT